MTPTYCQAGKKRNSTLLFTEDLGLVPGTHIKELKVSSVELKSHRKRKGMGKEQMGTGRRGARYVAQACNPSI